jgi:glycosyltransferase involved in cell wall biosynthesis
VAEKLSVALLAKDAAGPLDRCLRSVAWADEIVVLDGGSTDGTQDVARRHGARLLTKAFESFPIERQYLLDRVTHDWVLSLDADMLVPPALAREIQALMAAGPACDAYLMRCLNHFLGREIRHCSWFDHRFLRLFDRRRGRYDLTLRVLDPFVSDGRVGRLQHHLVHHQTESMEEYLRKMAVRYAPMTADEYIAKGLRVTAFNAPWYLGVRPLLTFLHKYVVKRGVLDGLPGFIICAHSALLYWGTFAIVWDRQRGGDDYHLERYLPGDDSRR